MGTVVDNRYDATSEEERAKLHDDWLEQLYLRIEDDLGALIQAESVKGSLMNPQHVRRLASIKCSIRNAKKWRNDKD